jgi:hypothetical protein
MSQLQPPQPAAPEIGTTNHPGIRNALALLGKVTELKFEASSTDTTTAITGDMITKYDAVGKTISRIGQMVVDTGYIGATLANESIRISTLSLDSRNNIYKVRQMTLAETYNKNYSYFVTNVMVFTLFITMLCLTVGAVYKTGKIASIGIISAMIAVILILYIIAMVVVFAMAKNRMRNDWNQFYFKPSDELVRAVKK